MKRNKTIDKRCYSERKYKKEFPQEYNQEKTIKLKKWQISVITTAMEYGVGGYHGLTKFLKFEDAKSSIHLDVKKEAEALIWDIRNQANIERDAATIHWHRKQRYPRYPKK